MGDELLMGLKLADVRAGDLGMMFRRVVTRRVLRSQSLHLHHGVSECRQVIPWRFLLGVYNLECV